MVGRRSIGILGGALVVVCWRLAEAANAKPQAGLLRIAIRGAGEREDLDLLYGEAS